METLTILKAEFVNEMEFVPRIQKGDRYNGWKEITHTFDGKFTAKVSVKVGNLVKEIMVETIEMRIEGYQHPTEGWQPAEYILGARIKGAENPFLELEAVGIEVDLSEIWLQYEVLVAKGKRILVLQERLNKWIEIRNRRKAYDESWIHSFIEVVKADKNKKIQAALLGTTFVKADKAKFIRGEYISTFGVTVTYRGKEVTFFKESDSYCYTLITYGKAKRAKRQGTAFLKFVEEVDIEIANAEYQKIKREEKLNAVEIKRLELEEVTGYPVIMEETRHYPQDRNYRRNGESYLVQKYYIVTGQPEHYYTSFKGIQIDRNKVDEYVITGLNQYLRKDQFKKILDVLVDGGETFSKVITPEKG